MMEKAITNRSLFSGVSQAQMRDLDVHGHSVMPPASSAVHFLDLPHLRYAIHSCEK